MMGMPIEYNPNQPVVAPRVRFETRAEEDRAATIEAKRPMFKDVDIAIITPLGSYSEVEAIAEEWIARQAREPYHEVLVRAYAAFKAGKEPPVEGTAIELCTLLTPADIKILKTAQCRTVEQLANWPDGSLGMFGMGAVRMKQKAQAWLESAKSTGAGAIEIDALRAALATEKQRSDGLEEQLRGLAGRLEAMEGPRPTLGLKKGAA